MANPVICDHKIHATAQRGMMTDVIFVYVTMPSKEAAATMAETLLNERLIACANILPGMISLYRWEGKIARAEETVLILKTQRSLFDVLEARICTLCSAYYQVPCIVALPVEAGHAPFLSWVKEESTLKKQ